MAQSSHVSSFAMNKTELWTGPVQETHLVDGAYGGEEASISVLQPGYVPASRGSLEPNTSVRTGWHVAQQIVPLDRPVHQEAGDERSCQPMQLVCQVTE